MSELSEKMNALCLMIEKLPASTEQTNVSLAASQLYMQIKHQEKEHSLRFHTVRQLRIVREKLVRNCKHDWGMTIFTGGVHKCKKCNMPYWLYEWAWCAEDRAEEASRTREEPHHENALGGGKGEG